MTHVMADCAPLLSLNRVRPVPKLMVKGFENFVTLSSARNTYLLAGVGPLGYFEFEIHRLLRSSFPA